MLTDIRKFRKAGHKCQISQVPDELPMFLNEGPLIIRIYRYFTRLRMATSEHMVGAQFLPSHAAVMHEHKKHLEHLYVIHPFSEFRIYWEIFMFIIFGLQFISIPFDLATYTTIIRDQFKTAWYILKFFLDFACLIDVCINFVTGYCIISRKEIVMKPSKILKHYCRTLFIPDVISTVTTYAELFEHYFKLHSTYTHLVKSLALLKLFRMPTFLKYSQVIAQQYNISYTMYTISMIVLVFFIFVHIVACTSIFITSHANTFNKMHLNEWREWIQYDTVFQSYCLNLYRALLMVNNMDLGLQVKNSLVEIYVFFVWIISRVITIVVIGYIMQIVSIRRSANIKYIQNIGQIQEYMRHKQLPETLQKRIVRYYEFRYQKNFFTEDDIIKSITGQLKQDVIFHRCKKLVERVDFLSNLPLSLLVKIVSYLHYEVFMINDVIFRHNTPGYCMYFISSGSVAIYNVKGDEIRHLKDGEYFGEVALLLSSARRIASVVSVEICELYRLDRRDFERIMLPHPKLIKNIKDIAEERMESITSFTSRKCNLSNIPHDFIYISFLSLKTTGCLKLFYVEPISLCRNNFIDKIILITNL